MCEMTVASANVRKGKAKHQDLDSESGQIASLLHLALEKNLLQGYFTCAAGAEFCVTPKCRSRRCSQTQTCISSFRSILETAKEIAGCGHV